MTPKRYQTLLRWLEARPALKKLVIALNRWQPYTGRMWNKERENIGQ